MKKPQNTWDEWHQRHRRFPGVQYCVERLKRHNTTGELLDTVIGVLVANATEHAEELMAAADNPDNASVRRFLLMAIEDGTLEIAIPFWMEILRGADVEERMYAVRALEQIDTKESRTVLWEFNSAVGRTTTH